MYCASCGFENQPESQFCEECGAKLVLGLSCVVACEQRSSAQFCPACGTSLEGKAKGKNSSLKPQHPLPYTQPPTVVSSQLSVLIRFPVEDYP